MTFIDGWLCSDVGSIIAQAGTVQDHLDNFHEHLSEYLKTSTEVYLVFDRCNIVGENIIAIFETTGMVDQLNVYERFYN